MTVPLSEQIGRYQRGWKTAIETLEQDLRNEEYIRRIYELGLERLVENYAKYNSLMYEWEEPVRRMNMDEELADFIVYFTSGDS